MKTSIVGYPRIGADRELKFIVEDYFAGRMSGDELRKKAGVLRKKQWLRLAESGLDFIPCNDFSLYDGMLDTAVLVNAVPSGYRLLGLDQTDTAFAMARGYQGKKGDVKALPMKKWFNTNYHYIVPLLENDMELKLNSDLLLAQYSEALAAGIKTVPVLIGPLTFLKLAQYPGTKKLEDFTADMAAVYADALEALNAGGVEWLQMDEPVLATDLTTRDVVIFCRIYADLLKSKGSTRVLLQTYFGDIRDCYTEVAALGFDGIGLDFVEGNQSLMMLRKHGFPPNTLLFAGVVNGKNIWRNNYQTSIAILKELSEYIDRESLVIGTSCSLLHVPYTVGNEEELPEEYREHLAFAEEKLRELAELKALMDKEDYTASALFKENAAVLTKRAGFINEKVKEKYNALTEKDFNRQPAFTERKAVQRKWLALPLLPTTTIGSFPQTAEVRSCRADYKNARISREQYEDKIKEKIAECISLQEEIGLDVLVHGEFERNDMVEYFGENLDGFLITKKAWVQSYGTRCVKPPIIWGDICRLRPVTVPYSQYAQSLTPRPVKGMITGPVTILNWSFPREDISPGEMALQIALALRDEVRDLEAAGIRIIQIDEAALKEKLPLRRADWDSEYMDWAIPAFRLVHSAVRPDTQIHTHMCYSEFGEIISYIDSMDADVISFEASRSNLAIVDVLNRSRFTSDVGPGVYDIHSPRVPDVPEITSAILTMLQKIEKEKLWINPDCGLKTRSIKETVPSLRNLVAAARKVRDELG